ncbi:MAG TPA: phosphoribosylamine--glycine ligase [Chitinophagaceae bacterium]|nr:phosphoribosylamine--glycine ligase [Chitinophagaceae bacterium]
MNILVLGSGGREHALAWKLSQSPACGRLFIAPGNGGTSRHGTNLEIQVTDFPRIRTACLENNIGLLIPGSEEPLVRGIADFFLHDPALSGIPVMGPGMQGAMLEGSKSFAKQFMQRHFIPTAAYEAFDMGHFDLGNSFIRSRTLPVVLKADGLAGGKGVVICPTHEEALTEFGRMVHGGRFGDAGKKVVVEQFLEGIELSVFILSDGKSWLVLPEAKDYKRIGEQDTGLNTGGMGAVSPVPFAGPEFMRKVLDRVIRPTMEGLAMEGISYRGFLFFGLINVQGDPYLIEYNCRLGDPETEVVLPRLSNDLVELLQAAGQGKLHEQTIRSDPRSAVTTVLVSGGYPGKYPVGLPVTHIPQDTADQVVFHGGTTHNGELLVTAGGRVFAATALGSSIPAALKASRLLADQTRFEGKYFRRDIGWEFD